MCSPLLKAKMFHPLISLGLVLVSPGTDCYHPATVLALSAALAPLLHVGARNLLLRLSTNIDDPLDVFATHLVPGLVGLVKPLNVNSGRSIKGNGTILRGSDGCTISPNQLHNKFSQLTNSPFIVMLGKKYFYFYFIAVALHKCLKLQCIILFKKIDWAELS